jgi:hypothetical protein
VIGRRGGRRDEVLRGGLPVGQELEAAGGRGCKGHGVKREDCHAGWHVGVAHGVAARELGSRARTCPVHPGQVSTAVFGGGERSPGDLGGPQKRAVSSGTLEWEKPRAFLGSAGRVPVSERQARAGALCVGP